MITIKSKYNNIFFSNNSFMIFYVLRRLDVSTSFAMFLQAMEWCLFSGACGPRSGGGY